MRACTKPRPANASARARRIIAAATLAIFGNCCVSRGFAQTGGAAMPQTPTAPAIAAVRAPGSVSLAELASQFEKTPDTVVAKVNDVPVTLGMVADRLHEFPDKLAALPSTLVYKAALDDLIQQRALAVKARELGLDKDLATQRRIGEAGDRELGQALMRRILPEMVTDKAIEDRYNATIAGKPGPEEVNFRVIATATEADANIVVDVLAKGTEFGALAQKVSKDPSAFGGGEIGYARRDRLTPEIGAVVFALVPGQTTAFPVLSSGLWFVIQVEGRRQQGTPTLAESKAALTTELTREASAEILRKTRAAVVVNDYGPTGMRGHDESAAPKTP